MNQFLRNIELPVENNYQNRSENLQIGVKFIGNSVLE